MTGYFVEMSAWLTVETVVITSCWWRGCRVIGCWCPRPSTAPSRGGWYSGYSLPPPAHPTLSHIVDQMVRPHAAGDGRECPLICCVMGPVNSCWTCSDARNIGRYNSSRFDTIHPVSVPIRYRSDNRLFSSINIPQCADCFDKFDIGGEHLHSFCGQRATYAIAP